MRADNLRPRPRNASPTEQDICAWLVGKIVETVDIDNGFCLRSAMNVWKMAAKCWKEMMVFVLACFSESRPAIAAGSKSCGLRGSFYLGKL